MKLSKIKISNTALFFFQVILIFIIVIVSIVSLYLNCGNRDIWLVLLSSGLGYLMPNPKLTFIEDE